jgi:alkylmercury lyase-like protein
VDAADLEVRRLVYAHVASEGRPPTVAEAAGRLDCGEAEAAAAYRRLHDAHALVLHPGTTEIWMAHPFCFASTPHRVTAAGREWTATCAWDALGIPAALHADGDAASACACCGDPLALEVRDGGLAAGGDLLVHFVVPARRWWDDIGFT